MSGASIPYHLRPHKSVDRRLFLDLLGRFERWQPLVNYVYVSMGAYPLEDHKLIHRQLGITKLIAFDFDEDIVARQRFNRPIESCFCFHKKSADLISGLEATLRTCQFPDTSCLIFWLDYTDPQKISNQIKEFESLLNKLKSGDIVRVTVNAHPNAFNEDGVLTPTLKADKQKKQHQNLKNKIGDYLPAAFSPTEMTPAGLPLALSHAFSVAALKALPVSGNLNFVPLSIIRYADGVQMLSITGTVIDRSEKSNLLEKLALKEWPFGSGDWTTIHELLVPALTIRERLFLERGIMTKDPTDLRSELGFETAADIELLNFLENYKHYYRFYPSLLTAEL